jgi:hypothetical protein
MQGFSYGFVIPDVDLVYSYSDDDCILVFNLSDEPSEKSIEVIEPEPEEHVQEAMTFFKWEF